MTIRMLFCIMMLAVQGSAQKQQPQFEAASVKVSAPQDSAPLGQRGGPGTSDPGGLRMGEYH